MTETLRCVCGEEFDTRDDIREHWRTNNSGTTGRPHYLDQYTDTIEVSPTLEEAILTIAELSFQDGMDESDRQRES